MPVYREEWNYVGVQVNAVALLEHQCHCIDSSVNKLLCPSMHWQYYVVPINAVALLEQQCHYIDSIFTTLVCPSML